MSDYRIVCTDQTGAPHQGHITGVGTGSDQGWSQRWTVTEVFAAMNQGHTFYTYEGGSVALVNPYHCHCGLWTLRSAPDATTANNLDSLNICRWSAA